MSSLRDLPSIGALLAAAANSGQPHWAVRAAAQELVSAERARRLAGEAATVITPEAVVARAHGLAAAHIVPVINATGVVLHTNLGRAPLAPEAVQALARTMGTYSNLEFDLATGERGSRHDHVRALLAAVCGAEDGVVVNNNAAAVVLALAALAGGRSVVVSRGEQVEIGGAFRIPEILSLTGCTMVEVGTTNKTRLADYERACDGAGLLLKVHRSNFAMTGFVEDVTVRELAELGRRRNITTLVDLGSGVLRDETTQRELGLPPEPSVRTTLATGVDLVCFSGDKLLGGPQAGILVGSAKAVRAVRQHPLMRVLRPDKLTLVALEATLQLIRAEAWDAIPVWHLLAQSPEVLRARADRLRSMLLGVPCDVHATRGTVGGGTMPTSELPSVAVRLIGPAQALAAALRRGQPPVVARIADGALWLDVRCVSEEAVDALAQAVIRAYAETS